jgi:PAS domain S-box-containing protein
MTEKNYGKLTKAELIRRIEAMERRTSPGGAAFERERLLHELEVHQLELETQNRELREAQQIVEITRDRYADLFDYAPVGYVTLDAKSVIREINLTAAGMLGMERGRLVGVPFRLCVAPEDLGKLRLHLQAPTTSEPHVVSEMHLVRKGEPPLPVLIQSARMWADERDGALYRATITDISRRVAAERALEENRARLEGIVGSAMDAIITIDEEQRIVLFNAAAERMFGCAANEALGGSIERFIPARFRQQHAPDVLDFGKTGATSRAMGSLGAVCAVRADGVEFPIEASISHVSVHGRKLFTVILRDVTRRLREEEAAKLRSRQYAATAELSQHALAGRHLDHLMPWNSPPRSSASNWQR